jgi:hypothetical protein
LWLQEQHKNRVEAAVQKKADFFFKKNSNFARCFGVAWHEFIV